MHSLLSSPTSRRCRPPPQAIAPRSRVPDDTLPAAPWHRPAVYTPRHRLTVTPQYPNDARHVVYPPCLIALGQRRTVPLSNKPLHHFQMAGPAGYQQRRVSKLQHAQRTSHNNTPQAHSDSAYAVSFRHSTTRLHQPLHSLQVAAATSGKQRRGALLHTASHSITQHHTASHRTSVSHIRRHQASPDHRTLPRSCACVPAKSLRHRSGLFPLLGRESMPASTTAPSHSNFSWLGCRNVHALRANATQVSPPRHCVRGQ
jgi:hypothetical protein